MLAAPAPSSAAARPIGHPDLSPAELARLRTRLLRAAQGHLRDAQAAEDAVQETVLALVQGKDRFRGDSLLSTYAFGILRYKLADALRERAKDAHLQPYERTDREEEAGLDENPEVHGAYQPAAWTRPDAVAEQRDFHRVLEAGLADLPARTRQVFMMREWLGLETDDIRSRLGISAENVWVMLHRARKHLQKHFTAHWPATAGC